MGQSSEMYIEEMNFRYETDEEYRAAYDEQMQIDAALEAEFFEREKENEKHQDFFSDKLLDPNGNKIELPETEPSILIDDDIPF